jgi:leucyl-tRNA synthetase
MTSVKKTNKFGIFEIYSAPTTTASAQIPKGKQSETKPLEKGSITQTAKPSAPAPKSFARRDHLRENEIRVQAIWEEMKVNESNFDPTKPKFFLNFPYPYMNGRLHLGHAFSLTKAEFTARFQKLLGKNVLFPFAFHCTGMPIQAAANKLRDEINKYGNPPNFNIDIENSDDIEASNPEPSSHPAQPEEKSAESTIAAKSKGKKTKLLVKGLAGAPMRQWDILKKMVPEDEIASFAGHILFSSSFITTYDVILDPIKWLNYFPPYGASDLKSFGSAIDWRRSFITTSVRYYFIIVAHFSIQLFLAILLLLLRCCIGESIL